MEPPLKRLKTEEEIEQDAKVDSRPKVRDPVIFPVEATTLNVLPSAHGDLLVPLTDGGFQYLLAGARANVGVSVGRYMFEVKIVEFLNPPEESAARGKQPAPRNYLRVGLATEKSSLFIGDSEDSLCFDVEGNFITFVDGKQKKISALGGQKLGRDEVITIVLNRTSSGANANTVSLFRDGFRLSDALPLPEALKGKDLYPALTWRNLTVSANFGPIPTAPLCFKCRMWQDAAQKDVQVVPPAPAPIDGKCEVLFPLCLPDEGTFDWLDLFLETNPNYVELSDRALLSWAEKSGVWRSKGYGHGSKTSNDKPEMAFGLPLMDDGSIKRILQMVAPLQNRNYIVMEVRGNLTKEERKDAVLKWCGGSFKRVALALVGEPSAAFKKRSQEIILKQKEYAAGAAHRVKLEELRRKRLLEKRQKELEKAKKRQEKEKKKREEQLRRQADLEQLKKDTLDAGLPWEDPPEEDPVAERESEEEKEPQVAEEAIEEQVLKVELTNEEKKQWFPRKLCPDLSPFAMSTSFTKFCAPEKDEGFDEMRYEWQKADKCKDYIRQWIQERKLTTRIEDISPSDWFAAKWKDWQKNLQSWHSKQTAYKAAVQRKTEDAVARRAAKKRKTLQREARERAIAEAQAAGTELPEPMEEEDEKAEEEQPEVPEAQVDFERLDVFGVEEFLDVGGKQPLFKEFAFEDWTMMSLRFEIHLLVHAFRKDVNDPDRIGIHVDHLSFYYGKYFKKQINPKFFGVDTVRQLLDLIRDTVVCSRSGNVVEPQLPDELESLGIFVMLTEEARRDRDRRLNLGDDSAQLNIQQPSLSALGGGPSASVASLVAGAGGARSPMPMSMMPVNGRGPPQMSPPGKSQTVNPAMGAAGGAAWQGSSASWGSFKGAGKGFGGKPSFGPPPFGKGGWGGSWGK